MFIPSDMNSLNFSEITILASRRWCPLSGREQWTSSAEARQIRGPDGKYLPPHFRALAASGLTALRTSSFAAGVDIAARINVQTIHRTFIKRHGSSSGTKITFAA